MTLPEFGAVFGRTALPGHGEGLARPVQVSEALFVSVTEVGGVEDIVYWFTTLVVHTIPFELVSAREVPLSHRLLVTVAPFTKLASPMHP